MKRERQRAEIRTTIMRILVVVVHMDNREWNSLMKLPMFFSTRKSRKIRWAAGCQIQRTHKIIKVASLGRGRAILLM